MSYKFVVDPLYSNKAYKGTLKDFLKDHFQENYPNNSKEGLEKALCELNELGETPFAKKYNLLLI